MDTIALAWRRIDTWFEAFAPAYAHTFLPGVMDKELAEAEAILGITLPADLKATYRIHNGVTTSNEIFLHGKDLYPLEGMIEKWNRYRDLSKFDPAWAQRAPIWVTERIYPTQPVQPVWWHQAWLPFMGTFDNFWCLDLAPAPSGQVGQILEWDHEVGPWQVPFLSLEQLLSTYAVQLEAGLYVQHGPPLIQLRGLTHLKERHTTFQQPSPAKSLLEQAIKIAWNFSFEGQSPMVPRDMTSLDSSLLDDDDNFPTYAAALGDHLSVYERAFDSCITLYQQVLQMPTATSDDRFFAYYGLISLYMQEESFPYDPTPSLFEQWEVEASSRPATHWVHEEVALWKGWLFE